MKLKEAMTSKQQLVVKSKSDEEFRMIAQTLAAAKQQLMSEIKKYDKESSIYDVLNNTLQDVKIAQTSFAHIKTYMTSKR